MRLRGDISAPDIARWLNNDAPHVQVHESLASTQIEAKRLIVEGVQCTVVVANMQTAGRGRMGREFFSPTDTGIYMSCIMPIDGTNDAQRLVFVAAVAVCLTLEGVAGVKPQIKWVNDVFLYGKKVAGILVECVNDKETLKPCAAAVGIGINVSTRDFPENIANIAGAVCTNQPRARIIAGVVNELYAHSDVMNNYAARLLGVGQRVTYSDGAGVILGVDDEGRLLLRGDDGAKIALNSGEISLSSAQFAENMRD